MAKKPTTKQKPKSVKTPPPPSAYYEELAANIPYERVQREVQMVASRYAVDLSFLSTAETKALYDRYANRLIMELRAKVAHKKFDVKTVRFPKGAWEFLKFNLIGSKLYGLRVVRWFIKRYPVKYVEVTMEANAYHPDIAIPEHDTFVEIIMRSRYDANC